MLVAAVLLTLNWVGGAAASLATSLTVALVLLFVGPHYAATYRRAYTSLQIIRAHPGVTLVAPIVLALGAIAAVRHPGSWGLGYFALYVVWSGYHYSGQSLGLAMLYPLRQGARLTPDEKRLISLPLYVSWILSVVGLFRLTIPPRSAAHDLVRHAYLGPPLPSWVPPLGLAVLAVSFIGVAVVARRRRARGIPLPWPTYAVLSAQVLWFTVGLYHPLFALMLAPVFHSLQYLGLTSWHACRADRAGPRRFAAYAISLVLLGLLINPGPEWLFVQGLTAGELLVVSAASTSFINLHHFLLDGRIWRLRERPVVQSMMA